MVNLSFKKVLSEILQRLSTIDDYVIESGTEGIWTWRKWNSGIAECWGTLTQTFTRDFAWGSGYYKHFDISLPTNLFLDKPIITASANKLSGAGMPFISVEQATATSFGYFIYDEAGTNYPTDISFFVIGNWKKTVTLHPTSYTGGVNTINMYDGDETTSGSTITQASGTGSSDTTRTYSNDASCTLAFDISNLPSNATITKIKINHLGYRSQSKSGTTLSVYPTGQLRLIINDEVTKSGAINASPKGWSFIEDDVNLLISSITSLVASIYVRSQVSSKKGYTGTVSLTTSVSTSEVSLEVTYQTAS